MSPCQRWEASQSCPLPLCAQDRQGVRGGGECWSLPCDGQPLLREGGHTACFLLPSHPKLAVVMRGQCPNSTLSTPGWAGGGAARELLPPLYGASSKLGAVSCSCRGDEDPGEPQLPGVASLMLMRRLQDHCELLRSMTVTVTAAAGHMQIMQGFLSLDSLPFTRFLSCL